jgi:hypothetical protein
LLHTVASSVVSEPSDNPRSGCVHPHHHFISTTCFLTVFSTSRSPSLSYTHTHTGPPFLQADRQHICCCCTAVSLFLLALLAACQLFFSRSFSPVRRPSSICLENPALSLSLCRFVPGGRRRHSKASLCLLLHCIAFSHALTLFKL